MIKRAVCLGTLSLALLGAGLYADTLTIGDPPLSGIGNCDPFGCPNLLGLGTYQQVYLSSAFPGAISIDGLSFFETQVLGNGGCPAGGSYTVSFSYTSFDPGGLNLSDPGANISGSSQTFFAGALPSLTVSGSGNELVLTGTPFVYNPDNGNLLLTVTVSGGTATSPFLFLDQAACGPNTCPPGSTVETSNAYFGTINGQPVSGGNNIGGLVTGFDFTTVPQMDTPEPGSLLLLSGGLGILALARRRRRS